MYRAKTNIWNIKYSDNYEKVNSYLDDTAKRILKIKKCYNEVKEVLQKYIDITKNYSEQITLNALKLIPSSNSIEGKLIQAVQGILLFNSEAIDILVKKLEEILKNFKASEVSNFSGLNDLAKLFKINYSQILGLYCNYINENELYEKYLIHKELGLLNNKDKIENNNIIKNNKKEDIKDIKENKKEDNTIENKQDNDFIVLEASEEDLLKAMELDKTKDKRKLKKEVKKKQRKKEEKKNSKKKNCSDSKEEKEFEKIKEDELKLNNKSKSAFEKEEDKEKEKNIKKEEILCDNHENIIKSQKEYIDCVKQTNSFIHKLIEFGFNEEKILKDDFYNNCQNFVDKLLDCLELQKIKYENQSEIIKALSEAIKSEKIDNFYMEVQQYSLHSLSIYMNNKKEGSQINIEKYSQKGEFNNELYKQLEIENIGNIINEMQKNGITVKKEDLENYEREKDISFIEKKIKLILSKDSILTEEEKNKLIEFFKKDMIYILFFLQRMNNYRAKGGNIINLETYHHIGELFRFINNIILDKNDLNCFRYISILSMTYFRMDGNKKIYIYEYIRDHPTLKKSEFWEEYLQILIESDIKNTIYTNQKDLIQNKIGKKEEENKRNFAIFSNVLTVINNMTDFGFEKEFINKFANFAKNKYIFEPNQLEQIDYLLALNEEKKNEDLKYPIPNDKNSINNKENVEDKNIINNEETVDNNNINDKLYEYKENEQIKGNNMISNNKEIKNENDGDEILNKESQKNNEEKNIIENQNNIEQKVEINEEKKDNNINKISELL